VETRLALSGTYITLLGKQWVWEVNSGTSAPSQHHWCRVGTHHFLFQVWWSLDRVSCLQIPKIHSAYIVLKEYCQLTCWIIGHPGSDAFQKLFWCHSMVSQDFSLPRSEKGFQNAHRIILVLTVLPCLDLRSFCDPEILEMSVRPRTVWNCGVQPPIELCYPVSTY
jgi:hypothetical protein